MPSKHDPPADSSSSSSEEEEEEEAVEASQDAEEDEEEEEEEDPTPLKPSKPTPTSNSTPQKQPQPQPQPDSSDSDESDSDDDETDSPTPTKTKTKTKPQTPAPLDIKPISSKPMPSSSSSAKPQSQRATVMGLASLSKRPAETDSPRKDKNKKKKKVTDLVDDAEQNDHNNNTNKKNNMFQRIWTEEDEIAILKCMISCKKKGMDVLSQPFVDTLKDSLQMKDVSKTQVRSKIRTLKKKFQNASKKPNPGENLKPHDAKVYVLSKKFWNEEIGKDEKVPDAPISRVTTLPKNNNSTKTTKTKEGVKDDGDKKSSSEYMYLSESSVAPKFPMMPVPPLGLGDIVSKKGWDVIGGSKAQKLDQKWKNVIIAETKAYLQRLDLVKEQTQAMLDALESSNV